MTSYDAKGKKKPTIVSVSWVEDIGGRATIDSAFFGDEIIFSVKTLNIPKDVQSITVELKRDELGSDPIIDTIALTRINNSDLFEKKIMFSEDYFNKVKMKNDNQFYLYVIALINSQKLLMEFKDKKYQIKVSFDKEVNNKISRYVYQKDDVDHDGMSACGVSSVAMLINEKPNDVDKAIRVTKGLDRQDEDNLINHIKSINEAVANDVVKKFNVDKIVTAWECNYKPQAKEFKIIIEKLKAGMIILYHMHGHYLLMKGYNRLKNEYIFYDPAGNKANGYWQGREPGQDVRYTPSQLQTWKIYGNLWAIEVSE